MTTPREIIRVEPLSGYLDAWKAPASVVTRHGDTVYVSGLPPFDPATGDVVLDASIERQTELVLDQLKLCLETAGSSLGSALKCNVYCTSVEKFAAVNAIYARYFPTDPPARIFVNVPAWPGRFDIEIDCIAAVDRPAQGAGACDANGAAAYTTRPPTTVISDTVLPMRSTGTVKKS